ncbi:hypothetical protein [Nesterenkonia pannonica]|uniref:hypothetical protein n=1 Tax=Nesterenkonia pannonica TaxID=1548602 RepID=UPI002164894E|nr:hypothetical protein [Nesterenkonia pannonica]
MSSERRPAYGRPGQQLSRREVRELEEAARITNTRPVGRSHPVPAQTQSSSRLSHLEDTQRDLPAQQERPSHMESTQQIPAQAPAQTQSAIPAAAPRQRRPGAPSSRASRQSKSAEPRASCPPGPGSPRMGLSHHAP